MVLPLINAINLDSDPANLVLNKFSVVHISNYTWPAQIIHAYTLKGKYLVLEKLLISILNLHKR
jgi:hypothetical protein